MRGHRGRANPNSAGSPALPSARDVDVNGVDPLKVIRAREILGATSDVEAIEVALDLLVLDDAYASEWHGGASEDL